MPCPEGDASRAWDRQQEEGLKDQLTASLVRVCWTLHDCMIGVTSDDLGRSGYVFCDSAVPLQIPVHVSFCPQGTPQCRLPLKGEFTLVHKGMMSLTSDLHPFQASRLI